MIKSGNKTEFTSSAKQIAAQPKKVMRKILKDIDKIDLKKETEKDKTRYFVLVVWEILLMVGVAYIQYILRPQKLQLSTLGLFLQGTLPSFFGSAGYCALFFVFHKIYKSNDKKYRLVNSIIFSSVVTFCGLVLWEFMRILLYPFDIYDLIMTFLGCIVSIILILILYFKDLFVHRTMICSGEQ